MNAIIEQAFSDFAIDGVNIPVKFLRYLGHGEPYIVYMQTDAANAIGGDDDVIAYVDYYDFDIYSKGDYFPIIDGVKSILKANGFTFQPSRCGPDMYETETGYYHKTLCFAIPRMED